MKRSQTMASPQMQPHLRRKRSIWRLWPVVAVICGTIGMIPTHRAVWGNWDMLNEIASMQSDMEPAAMDPQDAAGTESAMVGQQQQQQQQQQQTIVTDSLPELRVNDLPIMSNQSIPFPIKWQRGTTDEIQGWPDRRMLQRVATNNTVIVMIVSCPYGPFLDNAVTSLERIGYTNYVIVPLDQAASDLIHTAWPHHALSIPPIPSTWSSTESLNIKGAATYGTAAFKQLTSSRAIILKALLQHNVTVLYTDTDMYWKSPHALSLFEQQLHHDVVGVRDSDAKYKGCLICTGLMYFRPTLQALWFLSVWDALIATGAFKHDQYAMIRVCEQMRDMQQAKEVSGDVNDLNVSPDLIAVLPQLKLHLFSSKNPHFPPGIEYFSRMNDEQRAAAMIVHNNYITGEERKMRRFQQFGLWKPSGKVDVNGTHCDTGNNSSTKSGGVENRTALR